MQIKNITSYNNFNLLRLLAALQVVYTHTIEHLNIKNETLILIKTLISIFPGVPIFFLISGYLITMSFEKNPNIKEYAKNRILRIIPGLYIAFFFTILLLLYFDKLNNIAVKDVLIWIIAQLTIFQFYNPEFLRNFGVGVINGSLWTISIELCFYIMLPFLYIFLKKDFYKRLVILLLISFGFYYYITEISSKNLLYEKLIGVSILPYLFYFLFGMTLYRYKDNLLKYVEDKVIVYLGLYVIMNMIQIDMFLYDILKQVVLSVFIFSFVFSYKYVSYKILGNNDFTYGVYIYHMLIINVMVEKGIMGGVQNLMIVLVLSLICGLLSYFLVEKPFLNMKKKSLFNQMN